MGMLSGVAFPENSRWAELTPRERVVLDYLVSGRSNKYTAIEMQISQRTVEHHRASIYRKYGVRNAVQLFVLVNRELLESQELAARQLFASLGQAA